MPTTPVPLDLIRLVKAFVFASTEPVTPSLLAPLLPPDRNPHYLLHAVRDHCAGRGVILVEHGGEWVFRTVPDLAEPLQSALTRHRRLPSKCCSRWRCTSQQPGQRSRRSAASASARRRWTC